MAEIEQPACTSPRADAQRQREQRCLDRWAAMDLYGRLGELRADAPLFVLHDGPPYANGHVHIGSAVNKIVKDFIVRSRLMMGYRAPFIPGWDCHGLPVEIKGLKELGTSLAGMTRTEIRAECAAFAERFVAVMREEFRRLGILGEWERPFLTTSRNYTVALVDTIYRLLNQGMIRQDRQPVHWCGTCRTALGEPEIERRSTMQPTMILAVPRIMTEHCCDSCADLGQDLHLLVKSTMPWHIGCTNTLRIPVDTEFTVFMENDRTYIVPEPMFRNLVETCGFRFPRILRRISAQDVLTVPFRHPLFDRRITVLPDRRRPQPGPGMPVLTYQDTPPEDGHAGMEEFPITESGAFRDDMPFVGGIPFWRSGDTFIQQLRDRGLAIRVIDTEKEHPVCWACKTPVFQRITDQWFMAADSGVLQDHARTAVTEICWLPERAGKKMDRLIDESPQWCISRQRYWGVPLMIFTCDHCRQPLTDATVVSEILAAVRTSGEEIWYTAESARFIEPHVRCTQCGHGEFSKVLDVVDVWFESGLSHRVVLNAEHGLTYPADLYVEAENQISGWLRTSLLTAAALNKPAPYRQALVHGMLVDDQHRLISRSQGNDVAPRDIIRQFGADVLRLWTAMQDLETDLSLSRDSLIAAETLYHDLRSAVIHAAAYLPDALPADPRLPVPPGNTPLLRDAWLKYAEVQAAYREFSFRKVIALISELLLHDLRDRCLTDDRSGTGSLTHDTIESVCGILALAARSLAPVCPFLAEETWRLIPGTQSSVHEEMFLVDSGNDE